MGGPAGQRVAGTGNVTRISYGVVIMEDILQEARVTGAMGIDRQTIFCII
jgi:hypothetical protein